MNIKELSVNQILTVLDNVLDNQDHALYSCKCRPDKAHLRKAKFWHDTKTFNCFYCGSDNSFSLVVNDLKSIYSNYKNDNNTYKVENKKTVIKSDNKKDYYLLSDIEKTQVNALLFDLFNYLDIDPLHKEKFKNERKFNLFSNAKSTRKLKEFISDNFNQSSKNYFRHHKKTFEVLSLFKIQNINQLMYFFTDINNNFISYQTYDIDRLTDKKRSLITDYATQIYNVNELKTFNDKDYYFITESIEKLESIKACGYNGLGLTGIYNWNCIKHILDYMTNKKFIILFDTKKTIANSELNQSLKLAEIIQSKGIEVYISNINLSLSDSNKEIDIDNYLSKYDRQRDKIQAIKRIIKNKKTIQEIKELYFLKDNKSIFTKRNIKEVDSKEINNKEVITLDNIRNELPNFIINSVREYQDIYNPNKVQTLVIKAPAGSGKTHSLIELTKYFIKQKILYVTITKDLIKEVETNAIKNNIPTRYINSILDTCLDTHNITGTIDNINYNKMQKVLNKKYSYQFVCDNCNLYKHCKINDTINFKPTNDTLFLTTLDKIVNNKTIIERLNPDIVVFDENITNNSVTTIYITRQDIESISNDYKLNSSQVEFINFIKTFLKDITSHELKSITKLINKNVDNNTLDTNNISKLLSNYNQIDKFLNSIDEKELELNNLNLDKESKVENKYLLVDFLKALKKRNIIYSNNSLITTVKKEIKLNKNSFRIFLDATANETLIKEQFKLNDNEVKIYDKTLISDNLKVYQNNDRTFNQNNLLKNDKSLNNIIDFIRDKSKNKKSLLISNINFKNSVNLDISKINFGGLRGLNAYADCDIAFIFNPSINYSILELKAKTLFGITNIDKEKTFKDSNVKINDKYRQIENITYKDNVLNEFLKENRESEIYQAIMRINRNTDNNLKEVYIFSEIALTDTLFQDISYFEIPKKKVESKKEIDIKLEINKFLSSNLKCFSLSFYEGNMNKVIKDKFNIEVENKKIHSTDINKLIPEMNLISDKRTIKINGNYISIKLISDNLDNIDNFVNQISDKEIIKYNNIIDNKQVLDPLEVEIKELIQESNITINKVNYHVKDMNFHSYFNILDLLNRKVISSDKNYFNELLNDNLEVNKQYQRNIENNKDFLMYQLNLLQENNLINQSTISKLKDILKSNHCYLISSLLFFIYNELFNIVENKEYRHCINDITLSNELNIMKEHFNIDKDKIKHITGTIDIKEVVNNMRFTYNFYSKDVFNDKVFYSFDFENIESYIQTVLMRSEYLEYTNLFDIEIILNYLVKRVFNKSYKVIEFCKVLKFLIYTNMKNQISDNNIVYLYIQLYNFFLELNKLENKEESKNNVFV